MKPLKSCLSLRRYLVQQLVGAAVVNATVTALLTWWLTTRGAMPLWGDKGLAMETWVAALGVTVLTVLLATPAVRREARLGRVKPLAWTVQSHAFLRYSTHHTWGRAALFAVAATALLVAPVIGIWSLVGLHEISYGGFFTYKVLFVVAVGCIITPLNVLWVLTDRRVIEDADAVAITS